MAKNEKEITGGDTGKVAKDPGPERVMGDHPMSGKNRLYPNDLYTYARIVKELSLIEMEPSYKIKNTTAEILNHIQGEIKKFKEPEKKEEDEI